MTHTLDNEFATWLIEQKANQLVGHYGFTESDREDIKQDLKLELLQQAEHFDPEVAHWNVFVTVVVQNQIATVVEARSTEKREFRRNVTSLSELIPDQDGELVETSTLVGEVDGATRTSAAA